MPNSPSPTSDSKSTQDPSSPASVSAATPGPWTSGDAYCVDLDLPTEWRALIVSPKRIVATAYGATPEEAEANAARIIAGRDLYEATDALPLAAFDKGMDECDAADFVDNASSFFEAMTLARAALAKYRGEA